MPLTFLAHQAFVLPIARRTRGRVDGVGLVAGSMAPDMAFVTVGTRVEVGAHQGPGVLLFGVPAAAVVAWLIVRVLAPVVPAHLPDLGPLHLRRLRGLSTHRFVVGPLVLGAVIGIATHVGLDHLTHPWGWPAQNLDGYDAPLGAVTSDGRPLTIPRLLQNGISIGGAVVCVGILASWGRRGWLAERARVVDDRTSAVSHGVLWAGVAIGTATAYLAADRGIAADILTVAGGCFAGLCVASAAILMWRTGSPIASIRLRGSAPSSR